MTNENKRDAVIEQATNFNCPTPFTYEMMADFAIQYAAQEVEDAVRAERLRIADEIDSAIMAESWAESALTLTRLNSELIEEQTK